MKNIVLDHCRRWWWVFVLGGVYATALGWSVATSAASSEYWHGKHANSLILSLAMTWNSMVVMQSSCLAVFTGAMLLLSDLQRGFVRAVAVLPLTGRQLGRSWWVATVAVPAAMQIALLFVGAGLFHLFHPDLGIPVARLLLADLLILLWSGAVFVTYFTNYATQGLRWGKLCNFFTTATILWMMFGFGLNPNAQKSPYKWALFLGLGLLMTLFGWWRAGQFIPGQTKPFVRGRSRLSAHSILTPLPIKCSAGTHPAVDGSGGIPLLGSVTFYRAFLFCLFAAVWMPLAWAWQGQFTSWSSVIELVAGLIAVYWAISFFVFMPVLRQLRFLRTLPLSASRLALILIVLALLPLLALGGLIAGVAGFSTDATITLLVLKNFLFILAPASLCIAVAAWRGTGVQTYVVVILALIATAFGSLAVRDRNIPLSVVGAFVAIGVLLAFLITRYTLRRSSHAYRPPATPFDNFPWTGSK